MLFNTTEILEKYNLFWQYPVITEKTFYNQNKNDDNFLGIPWATLIDFNISLNDMYNILSPYIQDKNYYTCCQHIFFRKLIKLFKLLNIKTIYTPHKIINENIIEGITIKSCPLYAVNIEDSTKNQEFQNVDFLNIKRDLLYSFMGAYQDIYISDIRLKIFDLNNIHKNTYILNTGEWHFNNLVYNNKQNKNNDLNIDKKHINNTKKYNKILLNSRYSLCPSGSGPNSIRLWESLACGSIPILLADTLDLIPNIDWDNAIIRIQESDIHNINNILDNISTERESELRHNCINIYNKLKNQYKN
tara:strand:- start:597 stop:1505 length:909 start_codon:yes stop_codon:yes gene_type:complete